MPNPVERRTTPRIPANWRVLFGPPGQLKLGFLADASPMGVSIVSTVQLSVGADIEVHFLLNDDESAGELKMPAIVKNCGNGRIGVLFAGAPMERTHLWTIMRGTQK